MYISTKVNETQTVTQSATGYGLTSIIVFIIMGACLIALSGVLIVAFVFAYIGSLAYFNYQAYDHPFKRALEWSLRPLLGKPKDK